MLLGVTMLVAGIGVALMTCPETKATVPLARMMPGEIHAWTPKSEDRFYTSKNLYDYIDGGAEVYLAFSVRRVLARRYAKPGAPDLIADLFDMGTAKNAYGAYHHDVREGAAAGIGPESEYQEGSLFFWKGRYFASVMATEETPDSRAAVLALGKAIAAAVRVEGAAPALLKRLPRKGLIPKQVHYFHDPFCLNVHYFIADDNVLDLDRTTEGFLAQYATAASGGSGEGPLVLVLVRYPSVARARKAVERFEKVYLKTADARGIVRTENGRWAGAQRQGNLIVAVFDAPGADETLRILDEVRSTRPRG
jgi:hypothetical protein